MREHGMKRRGKLLLLWVVSLGAASVIVAGMALTSEAGNEPSQSAASNTDSANGPSVSSPCTEGSHQDGGVPPSTAVSEPVGVEQPASGGLRVFIDPKTGEIREPTPEEEQALTPRTAPRRRTPLRLAPEAAPLTEIAGPGGAVGVVLNESFMMNSIVRKNLDGTLSFECITGDKNAIRAVTEGKQADKPARKEDRHEQ
jgi:hypothetical protein